MASVSNPLRSVLLNLSKKWAFAGASLGIAVPVAIRVYEVVQLSTVPTAVKYLFWPTILIVINSFEYPAALLLLSLLGNALLFGAVAGALRRGFIFVLFILAMSAWLLLPPSDAVLRRRFEQQQALLQQVVEMSKQDSEIVRITFAQFDVVNGKLYGSGDGEMVLLSPLRRAVELFLGVRRRRRLGHGRDTLEVVVQDVPQIPDALRDVFVGGLVM